MKISIITTGSAGDILPFIALGKELRETGHEVLFAGPENVRQLCIENLLDFNPIDIDTQSRLIRETQRVKLETGGTFKFTFERIRRKREIALQVNRAAWNACQKSDLIIYRIGGYLLGDSIAEKLGIPSIRAGLVPYTPTRQFPSIYLTPGKQLGSVGNLCSYYLAAESIWLFMRQVINQFRVEVLGLVPYSKGSPGYKRFLHKLDPGDPPLLYAFSPSLLARPADWPKNALITGQWALETPSNWQPPEKLVEFLRNGPAPVYLGFGSMQSDNPQDTFTAFTLALKMTGQRGILAREWNKSQIDVTNNDQVYLLENVPHDWLFQHVSMAIHHGGIGTTYQSLKAGLPTIIIPFHYDQPFWGNRVACLGAGPAPLSRKKLNAEKLTRAIRSCLDNPVYRENAAKISQQLKTENGVKLAATIVSHTISSF